MLDQGLPAEHLVWDGVETFWIDVPTEPKTVRPGVWAEAWRSPLVLVLLTFAAVMITLLLGSVVRTAMLGPVTSVPGSCTPGPHHTCPGGSE